MRGQGLGPGFTKVATRRSVIFKPEGLELVLTFFENTSVVSPPNTEPLSASAEAFSISRRPNKLPPFSFMTHPFLGGKLLGIHHLGLIAHRNHLKEYTLRQDFPFYKSVFILEFRAQQQIA